MKYCIKISSITLVVLTIHMNNNKDNKTQTGMMANNFQSNQACISQDFPQSLISKKRVQFSTISSLYTYQDCQDNLGDSSRCRWYSVEDYQRFKQEAKQDRISCLQKKKRKSNGDIDDTVPFGLELQLVSTDFTKKRLIKKALVGLAVREEQERPTNENFIYRQERIAAASRRHSEWARIQAQAVGAFQAISVRDYEY